MSEDGWPSINNINLSTPAIFKSNTTTLCNRSASNENVKLEGVSEKGDIRFLSTLQ
jgi:hypothetical protein